MSIHMLTVAVIVISFVLYGCCCVCVCVCASVDEAMSFCGFVSVVALTFDETKVTFVQKLTTLYCIPYFFVFCILRSVRNFKKSEGQMVNFIPGLYRHTYIYTYIHMYGLDLGFRACRTWASACQN